MRSVSRFQVGTSPLSGTPKGPAAMAGKSGAVAMTAMMGMSAQTVVSGVAGTSIKIVEETWKSVGNALEEALKDVTSPKPGKGAPPMQASNNSPALDVGSRLATLESWKSSVISAPRTRA